MRDKTNFGLRYLFKPTPARFRRLSKALLLSGTVISTSTALTNYPWLGLVALSLTVSGTFLLECWGESTHENPVHDATF
jgi:hypothetical protein